LKRIGKGVVLYDYTSDFEAAGITVFRNLIKDVSIPTFEEMNGILHVINESLKNNLPVSFHCWGRVGRTGTVLGCYFLKTGMADSSNFF